MNAAERVGQRTAFFVFVFCFSFYKILKPLKDLFKSLVWKWNGQADFVVWQTVAIDSAKC